MSNLDMEILKLERWFAKRISRALKRHANRIIVKHLRKQIRKKPSFTGGPP